jgi:hypothetical protein
LGTLWPDLSISLLALGLFVTSMYLMTGITTYKTKSVSVLVLDNLTLYKCDKLQHRVLSFAATKPQTSQYFMAHDHTR